LFGARPARGAPLFFEPRRKASIEDWGRTLLVKAIQAKARLREARGWRDLPPARLGGLARF
jgi:hypothetical protein